jgi:hypothetical protein
VTKLAGFATAWLAASASAQLAPGPFGNIAGGKFELTLSVPADALYVQVGPTPVGCELAADARSANCEIPTTLGPGAWPVEIEQISNGERLDTRAIVELRVPAIVRSEPALAAPGDTIEFALEAPIPDDEPLELLVHGPEFERVLEPRLVRASRLRVRLPDRMPESPTLSLRVRGETSEPFGGLRVNRVLSALFRWASWLGPGLGLGALIALVVIVFAPKRAAPR